MTAPLAAESAPLAVVGSLVVILRDYDESDGPATLDVFLRAIRLTAARDYTPTQVAAWASDEIDPAGWADRRRAARTRVAEVDGRVAGFTDVDARGYVDMLFVDPAFARRGVASALLAWAATTAQELGAVGLSTHASLTARPFFEAHGFVVVVEQHPVLRGVALTNFVMRRDLARGGD
ncbi:GNAT family N-acetyltransferase [Cellulomonas sp. P5_C5]